MVSIATIYFMSSGVAIPEHPTATVGGGKQKNCRNRRVLRDIGNLVAIEGKPENQITRILHNEAVVEESCENQRKVRDRSLKKPNKTLTARNKAAKKLTDVIKDIDMEDANNDLAAADYVDDMYNFYKLTEGDGRVHDYMGSQYDISPKMRAILVDYLVDVHKVFKLMPETLYLTVNIVDRFLSLHSGPRTKLQLVGITSMLIACKYEEPSPGVPQVIDLIRISGNAYVREQMLRMEKLILWSLEWYLTVPTPYVFLVRYIRASLPANNEMKNMTFFFAELGLTDYSIIVNYWPSLLAASAVYAARCTLNRIPLWTETLEHQTGYTQDQGLCKTFSGIPFWFFGKQTGGSVDKIFGTREGLRFVVSSCRNLKYLKYIYVKFV